MSLFSCTIQFAVLIALLAVSIGSLNLYFRKEYVVHTKGVVLITGTSSGIGRHAAFELAEHGYVVFSGVRKEKDVQSLKEEAKKKSLEKNIVPIILDVASSKHIASSLETVTEYLNLHGLPLVGIVNNAGVSFRLPIELAPIGEIKSLFNINFFSTIEVTQTFLPLLRKHKGRVLFISSMTGLISVYGSGLYSGTKRAIESLVDSLRLEMNPFGVSVTSIIPGYIVTDIIDKFKTYQDFNIPDEKYQLYKYYLDNVREVRRNSYVNAPGPEVTSEVILHALSDPYPKTRYIVGPTGNHSTAQWSAMLSWILPDRWFDDLK